MTKASLDDTLGRKRGGEPRTETLKGGVMAELMDNLSVNSAETERARARKEEGEYWRRLADVVPERTIRVWKVRPALPHAHAPTYAAKTTCTGT